MSAVLSPADRRLADGLAKAVPMERNAHVDPVFAGSLRAMQLSPQTQAALARPPLLHSERIEWWPANGSRQIPDGRLLLKTRRDGVREGYLDAGNVWRLADYTVADVVAYADMPDGPLIAAQDAKEGVKA